MVSVVQSFPKIALTPGTVAQFLLLEGLQNRVCSFERDGGGEGLPVVKEICSLCCSQIQSALWSHRFHCQGCIWPPGCGMHVPLVPFDGGLSAL